MMLPFFPAFWAPALALAVGALTLRAPSAGLALALAAPILPLGNLALGLALALRRDRARLARRSPGATRAAGSRSSAGPLLAPLGLLALVPLAVQPVTGPVRRGAQALAAVAVAALVAGLRGSDAPVRPGRSPRSSTSPAPRAPSTRRSRSRARVPIGLVLGGARARRDRRRAPVCPRRRGGSQASARAALAATLLAVPTAPALPLVARHLAHLRSVSVLRAEH